MSKNHFIGPMNLEDEGGVMAFLQSSTLKMSEVLTGLLASTEKDWKLSVGHLVQAILKCQLFTQLGREISQYRDKGKIKEDYFASHKNRSSLLELLKFIDEQTPEEELFKAAKSIFFSSIRTDAGALDEMLAHEFLIAIKSMSGVEILLLKANFEIAQGRGAHEVRERMEKLSIPYRRSAWQSIVALQMGNSEFVPLLNRYELHLESLGFIGRRHEDTRFSSDFEPTQNFRLTNIGCKFCEFITLFP